MRANQHYRGSSSTLSTDLFLPFSQLFSLLRFGLWLRRHHHHHHRPPTRAHAPHPPRPQHRTRRFVLSCYFLPFSCLLTFLFHRFSFLRTPLSSFFALTSLPLPFPFPFPFPFSLSLPSVVPPFVCVRASRLCEGCPSRVRLDGCQRVSLSRFSFSFVHRPRARKRIKQQKQHTKGVANKTNKHTHTHTQATKTTKRGRSVEGEGERIEEAALFLFSVQDSLSTCQDITNVRARELKAKRLSV